MTVVSGGVAHSEGAEEEANGKVGTHVDPNDSADDTDGATGVNAGTSAPNGSSGARRTMGEYSRNCWDTMYA